MAKAERGSEEILPVLFALEFVFGRGGLGRFIDMPLGGWAGYAKLFIGPAAKVYKLTAFRTEGPIGIVIPLDGFTAGWTLHNESRNRVAGRRCELTVCVTWSGSDTRDA